MILEKVSLAQAAGGVLAHGVRGPGFALSKGRVLSEADVALLAQAGRHDVMVARLAPGDLMEDMAAAQLAAAAAGAQVFVQPAATGRANLLSTAFGLLVIDATRVHRINRVDEAITLATLAEFCVVRPQQMLATVKIIPFAVSGAAVGTCCAIADEGPAVLHVAPFRMHRVGLVQTRLAETKVSVLGKTEQTARARLAAFGSALAQTCIVEHAQAEVAAAIASQQDAGLDPILVLGAAATVDRRDVVPVAIEALGGTIVHFGMPVDPGNLLLLARLDATTVIGLPGCARSPKLNGFDWVLQRLLAGIEVGREDIMRMGVGGLLGEIAGRPAPRNRAAPNHR